MARNPRNSVVVVTGVSNGVGRAAALEFAYQDAHVVLADGSEEVLEEARDECRMVSGRGVGVPTELWDPQSVAELARETARRFGRIDVWVNNTNIPHTSYREELAVDHDQRVVQVQLMGCVHGARAALPYFRRQGGGVLINLSFASEANDPAWVASQCGIWGITVSLRQELRRSGVQVCAAVILLRPPLAPAGEAVPPWAAHDRESVHASHRAARAIVRLARNPRREIRVKTRNPPGQLLERWGRSFVGRTPARWTERIGWPHEPPEPRPSAAWAR